MILAQVIIILPIIISVNSENLENLNQEYKDLFLIFRPSMSKKFLLFFGTLDLKCLILYW